MADEITEEEPYLAEVKSLYISSETVAQRDAVTLLRQVADALEDDEDCVGVIICIEFNGSSKILESYTPDVIKRVGFLETAKAQVLDRIMNGEAEVG